ncbi:hypothetical protein ABZ687_04205 [Streptomyces ardesiacus]|uniref:hypothetical protein n=1 Tax=Streptomyces ardesiacus TaxID=285564 RepID=UPI0033CC31B7
MCGWTLAVLSPGDIAPVSVTQRDTQLRPVEALALVILGRFRDYQRLQESSENAYPPLFEPEDDPVPYEWEIVRSTALAMTHPTEAVGIDRLKRLLYSAEAPAEIRAVGAIILSASYADAERYEEAIGACRFLLDSEVEVPAITTAALYVQQGLREAEKADFNAAQLSCSAASSLLEDLPDFAEYCDLAARAMPATLATEVLRRVKLLLATAASRNAQLAEAMSDSDKFVRVDPAESPNRELRNRLLSRVTANYVRDLFERDVRDRAYVSRTQRINDENVISRNLHAVWLSSQLSGDWLDVLSSSELIGREWVMRKENDPEATQWLKRQGLRLLRTSGSVKAYTQAIRLMREEGPLSVVRAETDRSLERFSFASSKCEFEAIRAGAPLLSQEEANAACQAILSHEFPPYQSAVGGGWFSTREPMWSAIAALAKEVSDCDFLSREIRERVIDAQSVTIQNILPVLSRLDWSRVSAMERSQWVTFLSRASDGLQEVSEVVLYELTKQGDREAAKLLDVTLGSEPSLVQAATLLDLRKNNFPLLLEKHAANIIDMCLRAISSTTEAASRGAYSIGGINEGLIAAALSTEFPQLAVWSRVSEFLRHPKVASYKKDPVLGFLAHRYEAIPDQVRLELSQAPDALKSPALGAFFPGGSSEVSGARLRFLSKSNAISSSELLSQFTNMVADEDVAQRIEATRSAPVVSENLGAGIAFGVLSGLLQDRSVLVQSRAAEALSYFARQPETSSHAVDLMGMCLGKDGVAIPFGILRGIKRYGFPENVDASVRLQCLLSEAARESVITRVRAIASGLSDELMRRGNV